MKEKNESPSDRTLGRDIPELREYLRPGMMVLDVGCGPGTITLGVAEAVKPGEVVGIDPSENQVEAAREWMSESSDLDNCTFMVSDSHALDFPDDKFDLVYSHTAIHFFLDPVAALKEQRRVAKPGGWVIASGVRESMASPRYPECPNWYRVREGVERYYESWLEEYRSSGENPVDYIKKHQEINPTAMIYYDLRAGRKCPEWFSESGLKDLRIIVKAENLQYSGSEHMEPKVTDFVRLEAPETPSHHQVAVVIERAIEKGFLDERTVEKAREEVRAWYENPNAFNFWTLAFAAGKA